MSDDYDQMMLDDTNLKYAKSCIELIKKMTCELHISIPMTVFGYTDSGEAIKIYLEQIYFNIEIKICEPSKSDYWKGVYYPYLCITKN